MGSSIIWGGSLVVGLVMFTTAVPLMKEKVLMQLPIIGMSTSICCQKF